jgi:hypothetical protein
MNSNRLLILSFLLSAFLFAGCLGGFDSENDKIIYQYVVQSDIPIRRGYSVEFHVPSADTVIQLGNPTLPFSYSNEGQIDDRLQLRVVTNDQFIARLTGVIFVNGNARASMEIQSPNTQKTIRHTIE